MQQLPFRIVLCVALSSTNAAAYNAAAYTHELWFQPKGAGMAAPKPDRH